MKILTILGTRPEIIRLSRIIPKIDNLAKQIIVHTGQNYDYNLNEIFFKQLSVRKPDYFLEATGSFTEQIGIILTKLEKIIRDEKPDRFLVLGDTNSSMGAIVAKRLAIPVFHMEAGNRCYDDRVPEEVNRRIIDVSSDILMPYTERSRKNLISEGIAGNRIYVTGNPIFEVLKYYEDESNNSEILKIEKLNPKEYFLVTMHREENVDNKSRLESIIGGLELVQKEYNYKVLISTHPRTRKRLNEFNIAYDAENILFKEPYSFFDFIKLEKNAFCVLSDSGTVQEECAIFGIPNVTMRDTTERPETIECGSNILSGADSTQIFLSTKTVINSINNWQAPPEYLKDNVSDTVIKILMGYYHKTKF